MYSTVWPPVLRTLLVAAVIILSFFALQYVLPLIYPFLIGWIFAWMMKPVVEILILKGRFPRWLAVTVALMLFVSVFFTFVTVVASQLIVQIGQLLTMLQQYFANWRDWVDFLMEDPRLQNWYNQVYAFYDQLDPATKETIETNVKSSVDTLASFGQTLVSGSLSGILIFLSTLPNVATVLVIALLASFFIMLDWKKIRGKVDGWVLDGVKKSVTPVMKDLQKALFGFAKAQLILISITAVVMIIGLFILDVQYAFTIGLITGLVDLIPYMGTGAILIPWIIYLLVTGNTKLAIGLSVLYGIIIIMRQILEPKVLATTVGLDPLMTLVALFVGLQLFGFLGLIIGPVTLVVFGALQRAHVFEDLWTFIKKGLPRTEAS